MANVLLVDDRPENLLALEAILEPLGQTLLYAHSGEDALRQLLREEVAVILLDVQMPGLDGFETARLIKERGRTSSVPIIFVTAISKDEEQVFRGYSAGAVDYVFKPFNPDVLRSKVAVFIELHEKNEQLRQQAEQLREQELAELRRESEERYRFLAEAQPDQIWTALPNGELDYVNQRAIDYFDLPFSDLVESGWLQGVHPEDIGTTLQRWQTALATGLPYENEFRLRRAADATYRWHLARAVPMTAKGGGVVKWFGSNTDIDDRKRAEAAHRRLGARRRRRRRPFAHARSRARQPAEGGARVGARAPLQRALRCESGTAERDAHGRERARPGDHRRAARRARDRRPAPRPRAGARCAELHVRAARDARRPARRHLVRRRGVRSPLRAGRSCARRGARAPRRNGGRERAAVPRSRGTRASSARARDRRRRRRARGRRRSRAALEPRGRDDHRDRA